MTTAIVLCFREIHHEPRRIVDDTLCSVFSTWEKLEQWLKDNPNYLEPHENLTWIGWEQIVDAGDNYNMVETREYDPSGTLTFKWRELNA